LSVILIVLQIHVQLFNIALKEDIKSIEDRSQW